MRRNHRTHILAGTALALVLAIPVGAMAIDLNKLAFAPVAVPPAGQAAPQAVPAPIAAPAIETPAPGLGAAAADPATATSPAIVTEPAQPADPLAALDPADRAVAEK